MKFIDFCENGGGRVVYLFHVAGYPYVITSSPSLNPGSYGSTGDFEKIIFGSREMSASAINPFENYTYIEGGLQAPDKISFSQDDDTGLIEGGRFNVRIHSRWTGADWSDYGWPGSYQGLPGIDFIPEIGTNDDIGWGFLTESIQPTDETITFKDQNYDIIKKRIDAHGTALVWIGGECVTVDGYSTDEENLVLTVVDELLLDNGRGCYRSRPQNHYNSSDGGAGAIVSSVPLGSIAGKACYLWMTVVDDDGAILLDEGAFCIHHGRVQQHIKVDAGEVSIPVEPWINNLKQAASARAFSSHLHGYLFTRGDEASVMSWAGIPERLGGMPHLLVVEPKPSTELANFWQVWLCAKNSSVYFESAKEVISALSKELKYCMTGDHDQLSGSASSGEYEYVDFAQIIGIASTQNALPYLYGFGSSTILTQPVLFAGPCAALFGLCRAQQGQSSNVIDFLKSGQSIEAFHRGNGNEYLGANRAPFYLVGGGNGAGGMGELAWQGADGSEPLNAGVTQYYLSGNRSTNMFGTMRPWVTSESGRLDTYPIFPMPEHESSFNLYFEPGTDTSVIETTGDFIQLGSLSDDTATAPRALFARVSPDDDYNGIPALTVNDDQVWIPPGGSIPERIPALTMPDRGKKSNFEMFHSLFWLPQLESKDPWLATSSEVTITSQSLIQIIQNLLGFENPEGGSLDFSSIAKLTYVPDINDPDAVDQIASIDWDSFKEATKKLVPEQYYSTTTKGDITLYDILKGELQFHGVEMTLEPYTTGTGGNWIIRFKKKTDVSITKCVAEGRTIDETVIASNVAEKSTHNTAWKYSRFDVEANFVGKESRFNFFIDSRFAQARIGGSNIKKIQAKISQLSGIGESSALSLNAHFSALLIRSSLDKPIVTKQLTSKALYYINLGHDCLLTDDVTYDINTGIRGVTDKPCSVKSIDYFLGDTDYGINVGLAVGSSAQSSFGWAPSMICLGTNTAVVSEGATGTVTITPEAHSFTRDDDRTDLSFFRNLKYNRGSASYVLGTTDPSYKVLVMSVNDSTWTPVPGTISGMNAACTEATLTIDTSEFTISSAEIVEDLYIKFDTWENVEAEQQRFCCFADSNNKINLQTVAATETDLGDPCTRNIQHFRSLDFNGTWYVGANNSQGYEIVGTIFRHDGGTTWSNITNPYHTTGFYYTWLVELDGEIWCGTTNDTEDDYVYSYNPTTSTWTGRGKNAGMNIIDRGCVHDGKVACSERNGEVWYNTSGTTWTSLGVPAATGYGSIQSDGTDLFRAVGAEVYKYDTGTTWDALSFPCTAVNILTNWNGTLIASGTLSGNIEVYKYNGGTSWTQLGGTIRGDYIECLAVDSSNVIYAAPSSSSYDDIVKYDEDTDTWILVDTLTTMGNDKYHGVFNDDDQLIIVGSNEAVQWRDEYLDDTDAYDGHKWQI